MQADLGFATPVEAWVFPLEVVPTSSGIVPGLASETVAHEKAPTIGDASFVGWLCDLEGTVSLRYVAENGSETTVFAPALLIYYLGAHALMVDAIARAMEAYSPGPAGSRSLMKAILDVTMLGAIAFSILVELVFVVLLTRPNVKAFLEAHDPTRAGTSLGQGADTKG